MAQRELSLRESTKQSYLGYFDAILEKKDSIFALSLEELTKIAVVGRAAMNNCCNGSTGMELGEEIFKQLPVMK
ncbi:MAG: hypothetical protein KDD19_05160 [Phaeodactylibacter sp.]|nr:hypothetical protein [Phaeodactylibacter sp.]MCB9053014.1 hypothetical protein [Lewinellaceae bacterium]